ncbi:hypothetical protein [Chthonobacter rhizosphaerae]|uniref:hypothetical protein n=1 Tax=Chthonobacter rhizosphaerae TaxID=2735553 RepID=UPI0015EFADDD|nr:hypothetical protein [Chthonobacter rhizosphaerae]
MAATRILIATPTANGEVCADYCATVVQLKDHFAAHRPDVAFDVDFIETYDLRLVRNVFASKVLNDSSISHLLFFDSDMGFFPGLVEKMLDSGKPVVGVVSPARALKGPAFVDMARRFADVRIVEICANEYIPNKEAFRVGVDREDGSTPVLVAHEGSLAPVSRCGTGILLIHRSVFETLADRLPDIVDRDAPRAAAAMGLSGAYLRCFDPVPDVGPVTLGEDYAFCRRWTDCGGEIFVVIDEFVFHVGPARQPGKGSARYKYRRATGP